MIAGFDTEANNGSNNGVGICMIPRGVLGTLYYSANSGRCIQFNIFRTTVASSWEERYEYRNPVYLYTGMYYACSTIADFLSQILSTHLISRNQKFADTNARSTKYSNNVYYTTLKMKAIDLSQRQLYGTEKVADTNNYQQYGFDNDILPVFKYISPKVESTIRHTQTKTTSGYTISSGNTTTYDFIIPMQYVLRDHVMPLYFYPYCTYYHTVVGTDGNPYSFKLFAYYGSGSTPTVSANKEYFRNIGVFGFDVPNRSFSGKSYWFSYIYSSSTSMWQYQSTNFIGMRPSIYIR
jgi:hypothetical protein